MVMKKILVVDDSDYILESTSMLLSLEGYTVYTATNGLEGLQKALEVKPDLILCDVQMPLMDGYTLLEHLRSNSETESIPFIFLTAFGEKQHMREGMIRGADDYITKPITHQELIQAINTQWRKTATFQRHIQERVETVGKAVSFAIPHEFRTVLNEIIGSAKFIIQSYDELKKKDIIEISQDIVTTSNRLLKITENFLIYTKIEAISNIPEKKNQLRLHFTDEPMAILQDIAQLKAQNYNRINDISFENIDHSVSIEIASDSFYKIIDELIDNALKFSAPGHPIKISAETKDELIVFTIEDQGRGMDPKKVEEINTLTQFERDIYEQQGVGMGLIIAKKLVEIHDGKFHIDSRIGKGTTIQFSLHCRKKDDLT